MAIVTVGPSGFNAGRGGQGPSDPAKRGGTSGWSAGSARRNMRWLMSVDEDQINHAGFVFTFTVRTCPESHEEWARLIHVLRKYLRRNGCVMDHWVTEWQERGAPHLHGVALFEPHTFDTFLPGQALHKWLKMTQHCGSSFLGQNVQFLDGMIAWRKYVSKHAGRGYAHYQRAKDKLPDGWQKTGRMWGKGGEWPIRQERHELTKDQWFVFRRLVRAALISEARREKTRGIFYKNPKQVKRAHKRVFYLRRMLRRSDRNISEVRGLSEWLPEATTLRLMELARQNRPAPPERPLQPPERLSLRAV